MQQSSKIIYSIIILFIISSVFLFWKNDQGFNPDYQKDWWAVSFQDAKNSDLSFIIENHSAVNNFSWEIISGKDTLKKGDIVVAQGERKNIAVDLNNLINKILIRVSDGKETKEIYKNL
ncbi:hypothetical protein KJ761_00425 [Patescibacteria group bacterium]|nr:hypothetical protein [Patescibacteria group bacterium]